LGFSTLPGLGLGGLSRPDTRRSANFDENKNYLLIEGSSVFGGLVIHY
jgi:hypothetical protein